MKPGIASLLEPRISGVKLDAVIAKLGFQYSHRVEAVGFSDGIWNNSKDTIRIKGSELYLAKGIKSDHRPILISIILEISIPTGFPFRFLAGSRKKQLLKRLADIQRALERSYTDRLAGIESQIRDKLESVCITKRCCGSKSVDMMIGVIVDGGLIDPDLNNTLITLIPKVSNPETFSQFRPVSLCSVLYKLVMKVKANFFRVVFPRIVVEEQERFIARRNITNNILIAQEVIHSMRGRRNMKPWIMIKIGLEKAYDRVRWELIEASIQAASIPKYFGRIIMSAISNSTMQLLWMVLLLKSLRRQGGYVKDALYLLTWRAILAQSVLLSIPNYFMQTMMIPKGICEEIESLVRQFIWGSSNGKRKLALVNWESVCQPHSN
ncbi:reverse transcriptase [Gossypium australe]|uniref:Reverse transcriptase n=1 Tax=Gossypium australe TaxID=47621 RepID=A0A5B6WYV3_9ROSI|nr:reverse transcriptase [Gossypium australe]